MAIKVKKGGVWVDVSPTGTSIVKQYSDNATPRTERTCSNPIDVTGSTIGIGSTSNAYGNRFVQDSDPTTAAGGSHTVCDGDLWFEPSSVGTDAIDGTSKVATVKDVKAYNANGGNLPSAQWVHRDLNTLSDPHNIGLSISGNVVSVPAGTYSIRWRAPGTYCNEFTSRLAYSINSTSVSSDITYVDGSTGYANTPSGPCQVQSFGDIASITFSTTTYLKIEQYSTTGYANGNGLGLASNISGVDSVFTTLVIEDLVTAVKKNADYVAGHSKVATIKDIKDWNVNGGTFTAATWVVRDLNTINDAGMGITLNTNTAAIPAGTYKIKWRAPAYYCDRHTSRLAYSTNSAVNADNQLTTGVTYVLANTGYTPDANDDGDLNLSIGTAPSLTFTSTTYIQIQHYSAQGKASDANGLGVSSQITDIDSVYTTVEIEDLATAVKNVESSSIIRQVVSGTTSTAASHTNAAYSSTGLSGTITLSNTGNRVLVMVNQNVYAYDDNGQVDFSIKLVRTIGGVSTDVWLPGAINPWTSDATGSSCQLGLQATILHLDTPGNVGPITYHTEARGGDTSCTSQKGGDFVSNIFLQEVT